MRTISALLVFFIFLIPVNSSAQQDIIYPVTTLEIRTQKELLHFTVEVATTPAQQEHGLMFRKHLDNLHGMIFIFKEPRQVDFWMKNTLIPLDMLFVDSHGIITQIAPNAVPESTSIIHSSEVVNTVIEVAGGTASQYHIAPGDKVAYSLVP